MKTFNQVPVNVNPTASARLHFTETLAPIMPTGMENTSNPKRKAQVYQK